MLYPLDDFDQPNFPPPIGRRSVSLHPPRRGEVGLAEKTRMALLIFVVRRVETGLFDVFTAIRRSGE